MITAFPPSPMNPSNKLPFAYESDAKSLRKSLGRCGMIKGAGGDRQRGRHDQPRAGPGRGEPHLRGAAGA
jgi:hypothetical protein